MTSRRVTINITAENFHDNDLLSLEIPSDIVLKGLKDLVEAEIRIPAAFQHIYYNGQLLTDDTKTVVEYAIEDSDMLSLHVRDTSGSTKPPQIRSQPTASRQTAPSGASRRNLEQDPETLRLQILGDPQSRQNLIRNRPELAAVLEDPTRFAQVHNSMHDRLRGEQLQRAREIQALNADPFDIEAQMKIAEIIRAEQVQENLQNAMEHTPEVFGRVNMLYIDVEVNGQRVKAFVDSGAQATIMSPSCAEACNIMRLIDKRYAGIARGVGTANILGRVHSAQIKIGALHLACSFTVMEGKDVDLLLGLDMLKRHQAVLDLSRDKLVIQGVEVPFLGEADIPKSMEEAMADEPVIEGPGGSTVGAKTGAVTAPIAEAGPSSIAPMVPPAALPNAGASQSRQQAVPNFSQESMDQLVALGFSENEAVRALQACDGNVEYAAGLLFQG